MTSIDKIKRGASRPQEERRKFHRAFDPTLDGAGVWLVVPCYRVKAHILQVIAKAPAWVDGIVCVDDACPEHSGDFIEQNNTDPRVVVVAVKMPGITPKLSETPGGVNWPGPTLGEHTDEILTGLGLEPRAIGLLRKTGAVQ